MISALAQMWRRRWWRPDRVAIAAYADLRPLVVITGGSEGIGLAFARQFAGASKDLLLVARTPEKLAEAAESLRGEYKVQVDTLALDVTTENAVSALEATLAGKKAYADVLVNCAGMGLSGRFLDHEESRLLQLIDLNVRALSRLTLHFLKPMCVRGRGGVINMASVGSYAPGPNQAAYYASKAYVLSLTEAIAHETAGKGVRICALAPGPTRTRFHERMGALYAFYRTFLPLSSPGFVAWMGYVGFMAGARVVVPGPLNLIGTLAMRVMPHRLLLPIISVLLKPRL